MLNFSISVLRILRLMKGILKCEFNSHFGQRFVHTCYSWNILYLKHTWKQSCPLVKCCIELIHELNFISKVMLYYALNNILCKVQYIWYFESFERYNCTFMEHACINACIYSVYLRPRRQNRIEITLHLNKRC